MKTLNYLFFSTIIAISLFSVHTANGQDCITNCSNNIILQGGGSTNAGGGRIEVKKVTTDGTGANVNVKGGSGRSTGGNVLIEGGSGGNNGGTVVINGGKNDYTPAKPGNVEIQQGNLKVLTKILVGTGNDTQDSNAKVIVKGKIACDEIEIKNVAADFVFDKDYNLLSLAELAAFIQKNGHLPGIQPAEETAKGVELSKFNTLLLQKIEELTLYMLELKKENELLSEKIVNLEKNNSK